MNRTEERDAERRGNDGYPPRRPDKLEETIEGVGNKRLIQNIVNGFEISGFIKKYLPPQIIFFNITVKSRPTFLAHHLKEIINIPLANS